MKKHPTLALVLAVLLLGSCETTPDTPSKRVELHEEVEAAVAAFKREDPSMIPRFFDSAYGYAVFPAVGKGGFGVGGAYGRGELFEQGRMVGYCDLSQATIGLQLGGQQYREIIFFQDKPAIDSF